MPLLGDTLVQKKGPNWGHVTICFGLLGPFQTMIVCPEIKQKQVQERKTLFETLSLPVAKILSRSCRLLRDRRQLSLGI